MTLTQRIAAAVTITLGGLVIYFMFTLFNSFGSTVAFADVVQKIKSAHTLTCTVSATLPGKPSVSMKMLMADDPDCIRTEMPGGMVSIVSGQRAAMMMLNEKDHTATRTDFGSGPTTPAGGLSVVDVFRKLHNAKSESLGEKTIDGVAATGFKTTLADRSVIVWADKKTANPVRVEMSVSHGSMGVTSVVFDHFAIDPPLDDSLFSLDPPPGYTLKTQTLNIPQLSELGDEMAKQLGDYAEITGGTFPASLTDWAGIAKVYAEGTKKHPEKKYNFPVRIGTISGMLYSQPAGRSGYAGKDVKLGDKDKIVFWYQPDAKAKPGIYRAVFGDLHIAEVTKDQLPATQPTTMP